MKTFVLGLAKFVIGIAPRFFVFIFFGNIWKLRTIVQKCHNSRNCIKKVIFGITNLLALKYWESYGSWVGINAVVEDPPLFPHGPVGLFISSQAHIGKNCVIFQQVTIGSNTLKDSSHKGAPFLEDNVYIGSGAKIIGSVHVGRNARIGANCVVVKDVPDNSVTVIRCVESIVKDKELDNDYLTIDKII